MTTLRDLDIAARTVYGEARGEGRQGRRAVAWVIRNRAERGGWWGDTLGSVCRAPWQFSVWNENDPNREKLETLDYDDPMLLTCLEDVAVVMNEDHSADPTKGSCHYHTLDIFPSWARASTPILQQGNHLFYNDVD